MNLNSGKVEKPLRVDDNTGGTINIQKDILYVLSYAAGLTTLKLPTNPTSGGHHAQSSQP
jgi:hypothetical protein